MPVKEIYLGPDTQVLPPKNPVVPGKYTVADQARGWGVPEDQLTSDDPVASVAPEPSKHVE